MDIASSTDLMIGAAAIAVAAIAIYLFIRASGGVKKKEEKTEPPEAEPMKTETTLIPPEIKEAHSSEPSQSTHSTRHLAQPEVERARSNLRTLTLKRELLGTVLKRLFEAEDNSEITREERIRLSKDYEEEMKRISEDLKRSELIVTLNELETIREEIVKKFETTLNNTQSKIDTILKELKLDIEKPEAEAQPRRKRVARKEAEAEEEKSEEEEAAEGEEPAEPKKAKSEVEERLEQLRKDVLKELEELDKLEIES